MVDWFQLPRSLMSEELTCYRFSCLRAITMAFVIRKDSMQNTWPLPIQSTAAAFDLSQCTRHILVCVKLICIITIIMSQSEACVWVSAKCSLVQFRTFNTNSLRVRVCLCVRACVRMCICVHVFVFVLSYLHARVLTQSCQEGGSVILSSSV